MDDNPYKSPLTEGQPPETSGKSWRILARIVLIAAGTPFAFSAFLSVIEIRAWSEGALFYAIIAGGIAAAFYWAAHQIRLK